MCPLFRIEGLDDGLTNGLQRVLVKVDHVSADRMPGGTEGTLLAIGIIRDDVDGRNACFLVHRDMVVGDGSALGLGEPAACAAFHTLSNTSCAYFFDMLSW